VTKETSRLSGIYCIFAKWPVPGMVKTRLAAGVGTECASALAKAFLDDTLFSLARDGVEMALALDHPELATSITLPVRLRSQGAGDLGARMERVLLEALQEHDWAIAFGTDSPTLPASYRLAAVRALSRPGGPDAVIGPTRDGGYYLLGVRRLVPGCLDGIRWSTAVAGDDTINAFRAGGMQVEAIESWYDVDELSDLDTLVAELASARQLAPRTALLLETDPLLASYTKRVGRRE
jgi:rSAM/selenodomain-associated transferase 1